MLARFISTLLVSLLSAVAAGVTPEDSGPATLAVLEFEDRSESDEFLWLRNGLRELFTADLAASGKVIVVATEEVTELRGEQELAEAGVVRSGDRPPSVPAAVRDWLRGQLKNGAGVVRSDDEPRSGRAAARYWLRGQYKVEAGDIDIQARVVEAASDSPIAVAARSGPLPDTSRIVTETVVKLLASMQLGLKPDELATFKSLPRPGYDYTMWQQEGLLYYRARQLPEAWLCFRRAAERAPERWPPRYWIVKTLRELGEEEQAEIELQAARPVVFKDIDRTTWEGNTNSRTEYLRLTYFGLPDARRWSSYCADKQELVLAGLKQEPQRYTYYWVRRNGPKPLLRRADELGRQILLAMVHQARVIEALERGDGPAALDEWRAMQSEIALVLEAAKDLDWSKRITQQLQIFKQDRWFEHSTRLLGEVLACCSEDQVAQILPQSSDLGIHVYHLRSEQQELGLSVGMNLLVAAEPLRIRQVRRVLEAGELPIQQMEYIFFAPVSERVTADAERRVFEYNAAVAQRSLIVRVGSRGNRQGALPIHVTCASVAETGRLSCDYWEWHWTKWLKIGENKIGLFRRTNRGLHLDLFVGTYVASCPVRGSRKPAQIEVEIAKGHTTWFLMNQLESEKRKRVAPPATKPPRAKRKPYRPTFCLPDVKELARIPILRWGTSGNVVAPLNADGYAYLFGAPSRAHVRFSHDLHNWTSAIPISQLIRQMDRFDDLAMFCDNSGQFILTWEAESGSGDLKGDFLWWSRSPDLQSWSQPKNMPGYGRHAVVQLENGQYLLVFEPGWFSLSNDLIEWSPPKRVHPILTQHHPSPAPMANPSKQGMRLVRLHVDRSGLIHLLVAMGREIDRHVAGDDQVYKWREDLLAHFTTIDGIHWSEPAILHREFSRLQHGSAPSSFLGGVGAAATPDDGLLVVLNIRPERRYRRQNRDAGTTSASQPAPQVSQRIRTNPGAKGVWIYRYHDGHWSQLKLPDQDTEDDLHVFYSLAERTTYVMESRQYIYSVPEQLLRRIEEPLPDFSHLEADRADDWQELEEASALACLLFAPSEHPDFGEIDWPLVGALMYYLNASDGVVLSSVSREDLDRWWEKIHRFEAYQSWDALILPAYRVTGQEVSLSAEIVLPRRKRLAPTIRIQSTKETLPEDLREWARQILAAIGLSKEQMDLPQLGRVLFKDYQSMLMHADAARSSERQRSELYPRWFTYDPLCPFSWNYHHLLGFTGRKKVSYPSDLPVAPQDVWTKETLDQLGWRSPIGYWRRQYLFRKIPVHRSPTEAELRKALLRCPHHHGARYYLIEQAFETGRYELVDQLVQGGKRILPESTRWDSFRGCLLHAQGRYAEAAAHWASLPQVDEEGQTNWALVIDEDFWGEFRAATSLTLKEMCAYELVHAGEYEQALPPLHEVIIERARKEEHLSTLMCAYLYACGQADRPEDGIEFCAELKTDYGQKVSGMLDSWHVCYHLAVAHYLSGRRARAREILNESDESAWESEERARQYFIPGRHELLRFRQRLQERRSLFGL